ncbi:tryptophan-rich sensory protein [Weissella kandleri]|uniref:tryptophan-rich sensory protein n=1 Tax=Weissella kandleri TaxID=1616 RepID=UPI00070F6226
MNKTMVKSVLYSIIIVILGSISALIVPVLSNSSIQSIYSSLSLPPLAPPNWIFGPVWIILYILIGIYMSRIYKMELKYRWLMFVQLILNFIWTPIFFGLSLYLLASIIIILMDIITIILINKDNSNDQYLLFPYLTWILFATYLTISIFILN